MKDRGKKQISFTNFSNFLWHNFFTTLQDAPISLLLLGQPLVELRDLKALSLSCVIKVQSVSQSVSIFFYFTACITITVLAYTTV